MSRAELTAKEQYRESRMQCRTMVNVFLIIGLTVVFIMSARAWEHKQTVDACRELPQICNLKVWD